MSYTDKHIIETYSGLFSGLSAINKLELIEVLTKSIKRERKNKNSRFFKAFGAFAAEKSAEELIAEIKVSRKFKDREIEF